MGKRDIVLKIIMSQELMRVPGLMFDPRIGILIGLDPGRQFFQRENQL